MCCWGAFFNLVWKESCSCTLRLLWDAKQSTVSGNDQVIHFASTVLVCSKMLCRCIHHLISEGAGTEHTQPLSKDKNGWRQWDWNEKRLKILEQIPVSFIIVSTNGDTSEEAMTGRLEKKRGLLTTDAFAVLYYQSPDVGESLAWESGKKYLITPYNTSLNSCNGKWYWGFTWQNELNSTYRLRSESLIKYFLFHFTFRLLCHLTDFNKDPVLSWSKLQSQRVQRYERERLKLKESGKNCCYGWNVVFWGTQDINLTRLRPMLLLTCSALQQF